MQKAEKVIPLSRKIHETAIVHPGAQLGANVEIGPYAVIGEHVSIGNETKIGAHVVIEGWTTIGERNLIFTGAVIGNRPMDLKYKGEKTALVIGDENMIREYVTISIGTEGGGGVTRIGNHNLIMSNTHVAHDCQIGNHVVISFGTGVAGHVTIEDHAVIGGMCGIHQFTRIGRMAMLGACTKVTQDVPPYILVEGNPARVYGINTVGLRRNGVPPAIRSELKKAYRILYRANLNVTQAIEQMEQELQASPEIEHFIRFLRNSERGICR